MSHLLSSGRAGGGWGFWGVCLSAQQSVLSMWGWCRHSRVVARPWSGTSLASPLNSETMGKGLSLRVLVSSSVKLEEDGRPYR